MRRIALLFCVALCCSCGGGSLLGGSEDPPGGRNSDDEVRAVLRSGVDALNAHELNRFMAQFGADIRVYAPTGPVNGYAALRERLAVTFERFPDLRVEVDSVRAREIADSVIATDYRWRVYPSGQGPAYHGIGSGVYVLRGTKWQDVLEHLTVTRVDDGLPQPAPR